MSAVSSGEEVPHDPAGPPREAVEVSVVIPMLDAEMTIGDTLEALARQGIEVGWELIVVDNGSTDASVAVVESYRDRFPSLRIVDGRDHPGIPRARNLGAAYAEADFFAFTDADDVVGEGWLQAMFDAARRGADIVGGPIDYVTLLDDDSPLSPRLDRLDGLPTPLDFLPFTLTCNCGVSKEAFEHVGGLDTEFERGSDVAFSWAVQLAGYEIEYVPDAILHYRLRGGLWSLLRQQFINGRTVPLLCRRFGPYGASREPLRRTVKRWAGVVVRLPTVVLSRRRRWMWLRDVAFQVGRLAGCFRWRTFCP